MGSLWIHHFHWLGINGFEVIIAFFLLILLMFYYFFASAHYMLKKTRSEYYRMSFNFLVDLIKIA